MTAPHPIVESLNAEILADILQDEVRDYLTALTAMQGKKRTEECPTDVLLKIQKMTELFEAMQLVPWNYNRLRKWLNSWMEGQIAVSDWFIGVLNADGPKDRIAALSTNLRELATGKKTTVDYELFPLFSSEPAYYKGKGTDILKGETE